MSRRSLKFPELQGNFWAPEFLSQVSQKVVSSQLTAFVTQNIFEQFQLCFRDMRDKDAALIKFTNDPLLAADSG